MQIWTKDRTYYIVLSTGEAFCMGDDGVRHGWSYTGGHVGRVTALAELPPVPCAVAALAERRASRQLSQA